MKRVLFLSLSLLFLFLVTAMVFAATDDIEDPLAPLSPDIVTNDQYKEFDEPEIPQSPPDGDEFSDKLPQTGGIPAETFYIAGGICILSAIILLTGKNKSTVSSGHIDNDNKKP